MEDPPPILIIYCEANNIPLQHGAKSIELRLCIINIFTLYISFVSWVNVKAGGIQLLQKKLRRLKNRAVQSKSRK